jgi:CRP/FNR family transcriptional regulator, cyclic AMP receptor protein
MYLHPLLSSVPSDERLELVKHIEVQTFKRNEVVAAAEQATDCLYCVADGLLRVVVVDTVGNEDVTTDFVKRDEFFVASAFEETREKSATSLVAALPSSVQIVPWREFHKLCHRHPQVMTGLMRLEAKRTVMLRKQLRRVSSSASQTLVSRTLHELTQIAPVGVSGYDKRITQVVIASYTGLSREQVNKTMREFESQGLVEKDGAAVRVPPQFAYSDFQAPFSASDAAASGQAPDSSGLDTIID